MSGCIFCRILNKELPSTVVYEDENVMAIKDIKPQAPVHVIIFPRKHFTGMMDFDLQDKALSIALINAIQKVAEVTGIAEGGFRVINNWGKNGGQTVPHLHYHVLGGADLGEKIV
jgi:histidine triad (HIT) family protein